MYLREVYSVTDNILKRVQSLLEWYRKAQSDPASKVLPHPIKNRWKFWDDNRIWCSFFFSIVVPGNSRIARDYIEPIEEGLLEFELHPKLLLPFKEKERLRIIWEFGRGKNRLKKALGRFFSKPHNFGIPKNSEYKANQIFSILVKRGFKEWFEQIDQLEDDRAKAQALEILPGVKLKVSRDFLNDIGMTDSVIPLDIHILSEMRQNWNWIVPDNTPASREIYEHIENAVRLIADKLNCKVVEIDKAIYFARMTREF